ncbi:MAG: hypothetical protein NVSMB27_36450 [Ktedonobacteraceae bacterium]
MAKIALFLHGQGVDEEKDVVKYLELISEVSDYTFLPLSYGQIVKSLGFGVLSRFPQDASEDDRAKAEAEAEARGYIKRELNLEEDAEELVPTGVMSEASPKFAFNLISYSLRYLARRVVHEAVLDEVLEQTLTYIQEKSLEQKSVVLLAHSLGTVVALDLLHSELGVYFCKYISLGSPLGMIAKVPGSGKRLLPPLLRKLEMRWVDVAAPDDLIAKVRVGPERGFSGDPLKIEQIATGYDRPHGSYFFNREALSEWAVHLNEL